MNRRTRRRDETGKPKNERNFERERKKERKREREREREMLELTIDKK